MLTIKPVDGAYWRQNYTKTPNARITCCYSNDEDLDLGSELVGKIDLCAQLAGFNPIHSQNKFLADEVSIKFALRRARRENRPL